MARGQRLTRLSQWAGVLLALGWSDGASAHLTATGAGPVFDGLWHYLSSAEALIPIIALALAGGFQRPSTSRLLLTTAPIAWIAGGALGWSAAAPPAEYGFLATGILFMLAGACLAFNIGSAIFLALSITAAAAVLAASTTLGFTPSTSGALALAGGTAGVFTVVALAASTALSVKTPWISIAFRYGGSCIAAAGILALGWSMRMIVSA